jgi:hypothetical protein
MTLNEYIVHLKAIAKKGHGDKEVVYAADDEGNNFQKIFYAPTAGIFTDRGGHGEFVDQDGKTANAVCIN